MMKRDIYSKLLQWKTSKRRKPLLLRGARQVGKTFILKEFGRHEYEKIAYFDFEESPDLEDIFSGKADPLRIIKDLSRLIQWDIKPERHLLIFDEIQASNFALNSFKYFYEQASEYHIAGAGSLLGVKLSRVKPFPVGKVNFLEMYPLTFFEFLDAVGRSSLRNLIEETRVFSPYKAPFHNQLIELLREYFFVGGMPEAVSCFREAGDLQETRNIQKEIINSFILDFSKHSINKDIPKISLIWDSIPAQLARENKKFLFTAVKKSARAREYENAIEWLADAGLVYKSYLVSTAKRPLKGYMNRDVFKLFVLDVGILGAMARIPADMLVKGSKLFNEYQGAFVENYVAQQLCSYLNVDLYYWKSEGKKAELDFLCEYGSQILPLEAKAGINPRSKSLKSYDTQFAPTVLSRTTLLNLKQDGKICNYPLYAVSLFPTLAIS